MIVFIVVGLFLLFCFSFVLMFGSPYLPTLKAQRQTALDLLDLKKGEVLLELGCGEGLLMREAAKRGINVIGFELNPILVFVAKLVNYRYRRRVTVIWGNFWVKDWPKCDGIYAFLHGSYMDKLHQHLARNRMGNIKLVSYAFKITGKKPSIIRNGLYLYKY